MPRIETQGLPLGYLPDTVFTQEELAGVLGVSVDTLTRSAVPVSYALGERKPRYIWKHVIAWLEKGIAA